MQLVRTPLTVSCGLIPALIVFCSVRVCAQQDYVLNRLSLQSAESSYYAGRKLEAEGNYGMASFQYKDACKFVIAAGPPGDYAIVSLDKPSVDCNYDYSKVNIGGETPATIGKRAISCYLKFVQNPNANVSAPSTWAPNSSDSNRDRVREKIAKSASKMIDKTIFLGELYDKMIDFEPNNPSWYYLSGLARMAEKNEALCNYTMAENRFLQCKLFAKRTGTHSDLIAKCDSLLGQLKTIAANQRTESSRHFQQGLSNAANAARSLGDQMVQNDYANVSNKENEAKNAAASGDTSRASAIRNQIQQTKSLYKQRFGK